MSVGISNPWLIIVLGYRYVLWQLVCFAVFFDSRDWLVDSLLLESPPCRWFAPCVSGILFWLVDSLLLESPPLWVFLLFGLQMYSVVLLKFKLDTSTSSCVPT